MHTQLFYKNYLNNFPNRANISTRNIIELNNITKTKELLVKKYIETIKIHQKVNKIEKIESIHFLL